MPITLTEDQISKCLQDAIQDDPSSDGFSEIELTEETRLKCAAVLIPLVFPGPRAWLLQALARREES